jgi:murein DD-endopeptidase MepM/ murein hydrolase activator NlpD
VSGSLVAPAAVPALAAETVPAEPARTPPNADAFGIRVLLPAGATRATPPPGDGGPAYRYPAGGRIAAAGPISVHTAATRDAARARVVVTGLRLFGGEIAVGRVIAAADGAARWAPGRLEGLVVRGAPGAGDAPATIDLGWGTLVLLDRAPGTVTALNVILTAPHGGLPAGAQVVVGHAGATLGDAAADPGQEPDPQPKPAPEPKPRQDPGDGPSGAPADPNPGDEPGTPSDPPADPAGEPGAPSDPSQPPAEPTEGGPSSPAAPSDGRDEPAGGAPATDRDRKGGKRDGDRQRRPKSRGDEGAAREERSRRADRETRSPGAPERRPAPRVEPRLTPGGYVFPIVGPVAFGDSFGADRAITGWHHGEDIFAAAGAPILAVADGELFKVGWNAVGGWRVWLRDDRGNEFYYAHLSAYAPRAKDGAQVRAGDVIGYVGTTGDAAGTPPHLHFEIHPRQLLALGYDGVVRPFAYLTAWGHLADRSLARARHERPAPATSRTPRRLPDQLAALDARAAGTTEPVPAPELAALPAALLALERSAGGSRRGDDDGAPEQQVTERRARGARADGKLWVDRRERLGGGHAEGHLGDLAG